MFHFAKLNAKTVLDLKVGDKVILTGGPANGQAGTTNMIKLETVEKV